MEDTNLRLSDTRDWSLSENVMVYSASRPSTENLNLRTMGPDGWRVMLYFARTVMSVHTNPREPLMAYVRSSHFSPTVDEAFIITPYDIDVALRNSTDLTSAVLPDALRPYTAAWLRGVSRGPVRSNVMWSNTRKFLSSMVLNIVCMNVLSINKLSVCIQIVSGISCIFK